MTTDELQAAEAEARAALKRILFGVTDASAEECYAVMDGFAAAIRATEAARYRDEAMVERVAAALFVVPQSPTRITKGGTGFLGTQTDGDYWRNMARAALAVITEPDDGNSTVQG